MEVMAAETPNDREAAGEAVDAMEANAAAAETSEDMEVNAAAAEAPNDGQQKRARAVCHIAFHKHLFGKRLFRRVAHFLVI